ncbi:MAG: small-conductance mechanosensitive channel MscS [Candidatus Kapaibacteriales bacterium]
MDDIMDIASPWLTQIADFAWDFLAAILIFIVGRFIISALLKAYDRRVNINDLDVTKKEFLRKFVKAGLTVVLLIVIAGVLGISTASLVALLGAAGLAIGLALQGSLSNIAGGFLIMVQKPFEAGHWIDAQGESGTVVEVGIVTTILKTPDNKVIYIPNGQLANGNITNYSQEPERRLDMTFGIGYSDDIDKAKAILQSIMDSDPRVLKDRANQISVAELADSSVNFTWRAWVKGSDYWPLHFDMQERVKKEFDANGISIPFPQQDVHVNMINGN